LKIVTVRIDVLFERSAPARIGGAVVRLVRLVTPENCRNTDTESAASVLSSTITERR
jgi:hypothetical protein